ncbi:predicted protein [Aspergillus terreus NIH2624]|uniref:Microbial-type PARG catalytic domain-containing protein n=1 Tax=Aspergillus terreus (strain NIH 2624 / FGSC A1156) TaxID=341663 RepID=Q0CR18_ASPTN|nr:uncharacterized protein ATEG_03866 [Aspergillus terreus NIH2624]EAU35668.1 predicted protein [Aspergillus terreus NIH2624]
MSQRLSPSNRRELLRSVAEETKTLLPNILALRPQDPPTGIYLQRERIRALGSRYNPNLSAQVEVVNADTFDTAIRLANSPGTPNGTDAKKVCVLNMASEKHAGGGWLRGALAQEEELCYRSSLSFTLKRRFYPIRDNDALYSPNVVIFREGFTNGHRLMDLQRPELLPAVSVISIAALRRPSVNHRLSPPAYVRPADRETMKDKMRSILRIAAFNKHRKLVLGALGCGAFANPKEEVANCWAAVLREPEFQGWWENIVFAVLDNTAHLTNSDGNFDTFHSTLHGLRL